MTTFALYPIDQVRPHPSNVRRTAVASDEMVESIRSAGILEPVILGPEVTLDDGATVRYLIAGNVRYDGATRAGLDALPAVLRDDLATEAQQIEAMLVENLHRTDLTAVEEAEAYEQLQLFGMDEAAIAAATGRSKATVHSRLRLVDLPTKALDRLHAGEATLVDAEALLEFDDDHEVQAALEAALGTSDFRWKVQSARDTRFRAERNAKVVAEFSDLDAAPADPSADDWQRLTSFWTKDLQESAGHTHSECLGFVDHGAASYGTPFLVCLDPESHAEQEAQTRSQVSGSGGGNVYQPDVDYEARREQAARERAERAAAEKVRIDHIVTTIATAVPGKGKHATTLAGAARAFLPILLANSGLLDIVGGDVLDHSLGLATDDNAADRYEQREAFAATLATDASDSVILKALTGVLAALTENALSTVIEQGRYITAGDLSDVTLSQSAWEWLTSTGYPLSEADQKSVDLLATMAAPADENGDD